MKLYLLHRRHHYLNHNVIILFFTINTIHMKSMTHSVIIIWIITMVLLLEISIFGYQGSALALPPGFPVGWVSTQSSRRPVAAAHTLASPLHEGWSRACSGNWSGSLLNTFRGFSTLFPDSLAVGKRVLNPRPSIILSLIDRLTYLLFGHVILHIMPCLSFKLGITFKWRVGTSPSSNLVYVFFIFVHMYSLVYIPGVFKPAPLVKVFWPN